MSNHRQLWRIFRLRLNRGEYWNSKPREEWRECGLIEASDEDAAGSKALRIIGEGPLRVEPVDEFYRPVSLDSIP